MNFSFNKMAQEQHMEDSLKSSVVLQNTKQCSEKLCIKAINSRKYNKLA